MSVLLIIMSTLAVKGQTGYTCIDAIPLTLSNNSCSDSAQYNNSNPAQNGVSWFSFTPDSASVYLTVNGQGASGSLLSPQVTLLYGGCNGTVKPGTSTTINNVTTFYSDGLVKGAKYYIMVSGANKQTGRFKLCISNFKAEIGYTYCQNAVYLCNNSDYSRRVSVKLPDLPPGPDQKSVAGTCINFEFPAVWFKWKAANSGTLVFTITPGTLQTIARFILYDLGTSASCSGANAASAIRCNGWPGTVYCKTPVGQTFLNSNFTNAPIGLDFNETDLTKANNCDQGQNGLLKFVSMTAGHVYALAVEVDDVGASIDFDLSFKDTHGKAGTGLITSPDPEIVYAAQNSGCTSDRTYTFSCPVPNFHVLNWDFGGGSLVSAGAGRNYTVHYDTPGPKTVKLYATDDHGCTATNTISFVITDAPVIAAPAIVVNKPRFCIGDTVLLTTVQQPGLSYKWTGPGQFTASGTSVSLLVTAAAQAGKYTLTAYQGACGSAATSVNIASFLARPVAAFSTDPALPATRQNLATLTLTNQSAGADSYLWDFGDGTTSTTISPAHQYKQGTYKITLTAYQSTACSNSVTKGTFTVRNITSTFIPNTFTPNGDGINDYLDIVMVNVSTSHLQLFNRYGQQVFETYNNAKNWNGIYNGKPLPVGVYYYILSLAATDGTASRQSGSVIIIR